MIEPGDRPLLVPMRVEALMLGTVGGSPKWSDFRPKLENLQNGFVPTADILDPPLHDGQRPEPGVHLHFRPPAFFTHGLQDENGELVFDRLPNRWLVQRLWQAGGQRRHRAWLVRSDARDGDGHPWMVQKADGSVEIVRYGAAAALDAAPPAEEDPDRQLRLTAVGQGDPAFVGHYPACRRMLGFHDPLDDVEGVDMEVSYLVSGFFSNAATDPLHTLPANDREAMDRWLHDRDLTLDRPPDATELPRRLVCSAIVTDLRWQGTEHGYDWALSACEVPFRGVAIGDSASGALAALLDDSAVKQDALEAIHDGLADRRQSVEALHGALHARRFDAAHGGTAYRISRKAADTQGTQTARQIRKGGQDDALPTALRAALDDLNRSLAVRDAAARRLADRRRRLYAAWCVVGDPFANVLDETDLALLKQQIEGDIEALRAAEADVGTMLDLDDPAVGDDPETPRRFRGRMAEALAAAAGADGADGFDVTETVAPPFHDPATPALALEGEAVRQLNAVTSPSSLTCRQIVDDDGSRRAAADETLRQTFGEVPATLDATHRILLAEALGIMRHPPRAPSQDEPGVNRWTANPWTPLFLAWRLTSTEIGDPLARERFMNGWTLDDYGDLALSAPDAPEEGQQTQIEGFGLVSRTLVHQLAEEIRLAAKRIGTSAGDHPLIGRLETGALAVQRMVGFDAALRGERPALSIAPLAGSNGQLRRDDDLCDWLDWQNTGFSYQPGEPDRPFVPIRAGMLRVDKLAIIDGFGQKIEVDFGTSPITGRPPVKAAKAAIAGENSASQPGFRLRPRLVQPARLRFEPAEPEAHGWVVPNILERSLVLHDSAGRAVLALQRRLGDGGEQQGRRGFFAVYPPRAGEQETGQGAGVPSGLDPCLAHFAKWALGLDGDGAKMLLALIEEAADALHEREPDDESGVAALLGRPLALVSARVGIDIAGLPSVALPDLAKDETAPVQAIRWPVWIGDRGLANDGTVGLFPCGDDAKPASDAPFCPARGSRAFKRRPEGFAAQSLGIDARGRDGDTYCLVLFDPRGRVHAATGILPRGTLSRFSGSGGHRIGEAFFQTAPLLGPNDSPGLPRPSDDYGEWTWAWRPDVTRTVVDGLREASIRAKELDRPTRIAEGWLKLALTLRIERFDAARRGDGSVGLSWTVRGAEAVVLEITSAEHGETRRVTVDAMADDHVEHIEGRTAIRLRATSAGAEAIRDLTVG